MKEALLLTLILCVLCMAIWRKSIKNDGLEMARYWRISGILVPLPTSMVEDGVDIRFGWKSMYQQSKESDGPRIQERSIKANTMVVPST